jgi:hypothetical protein
MSLRSLQSRLRQSSANIRLLRRFTPEGQAPRNDRKEALNAIRITQYAQRNDYKDFLPEVKEKNLQLFTGYTRKRQNSLYKPTNFIRPI